MAFARTAPARPRVARRSSGSTGARTGIRWDRLARISLLLVLGLIVASYVGPATSYIKAWRFAGETRSELHQLQHENKALRKRVKQLHDPRRIELEARGIGMAKPGEKAYVIKGLPRERPAR
ncbi:MAG: septum formation initiator family protein [Solirubrobacterales bacterium]